MRDGLKIIKFLPDRYGYGITKIGWVRRVNGDEYELLAGRTLWRKRGNYDLSGLEKLAADGISSEYAVSDPGKLPEELHRLLVRRVFVASEKAWREQCPSPKDWTERE